MMALEGENQDRGSSQREIPFHSALNARSEHLYSCSLSSMLISASKPLRVAEIRFRVSSDTCFLGARLRTGPQPTGLQSGSMYSGSGILFRRDCMRRKARIAASTTTGGPRMNIALSFDMLYIMLLWYIKVTEQKNDFRQAHS